MTVANWAPNNYFMVRRRVTLIFVPMSPSNQVFSIQLISVCCRSSHHWTTGEHLQLADAEAGAGERTEGGSWNSGGEESWGEGSARKCLWVTLLKCQLLWIVTLKAVTFELQLKEGKRALSFCIIYRNLDSKIGVWEVVFKLNTNDAEEALSKYHGTPSGQHTSS